MQFYPQKNVCEESNLSNKEIVLMITFVASFDRHRRNQHMSQGGNSQNFLGKFVRFFVTFRCFHGVVIQSKEELYYLYSS